MSKPNTSVRTSEARSKPPSRRKAEPPPEPRATPLAFTEAACERLRELADFRRDFLDEDMVDPTTAFSPELMTGADRVYPDFAGYKNAPDEPHRWLVWCWSRGLRVVCIPVPRDPADATEEGLTQAVQSLAVLLRCQGLEPAIRHWILTGELPA